MDSPSSSGAVAGAATKNNTGPSSTLPDDFPFIPIGHPDTMMSVESVRRAAEEFQTRPTDIIVATFPKTGTTLVTWICHQLRTGGDTNFDCIYDVVPWPTLCWDIGHDANTQQGNGFVPRVFKSHLRMASIYRGCKYIVTIRDPLKTVVSFYNFIVHAKNVPDFQDMDLSEFTRLTPFLQGNEDGTRASIWDFYYEYHLLLNCSDVLILVYEDLVKDMKKQIEIIAKFMNIPYDEDLISKVVNMSTKEYMAEHQSKFDEPYEQAKELGRVGDLSQLAPGAKVAVNKHQQVMDDIGNRFLLDEWKKTMAPIGYPDYNSFVSAIRQINKDRYLL